MKQLIIIAIVISMIYLLAGCGDADAIVNKKTTPSPPQASILTPTPVPEPVATMVPEPITTMVPEPVTTMEPSFYSITTGNFGDYNIVFEINGYLYRFVTEMLSNDIELIIEPKIEEERYGQKIMANPVFVTNGEEKEQLGIIHGYQFDVRSDSWVQPYYFDGNKLCGKIVSVNETGITVCLAEEIDRDTYMEFVNISEEETYFEFSEDIEYVVHDINMRATEVTHDRFMEHLSRNPDMIYYLFEHDGKIVQVWEPYIP